VKRTGLLFAICILALITACSKEQPGEIYFPKGSEGAKWEYGVRYSTPQGAQMGSMVIRIEGEETINGKKYYRQVTDIAGVPGAKSKLNFNRRSKEGIYKIDQASQNHAEILMTPFPLKVGDTWTTRSAAGTTTYKAEKVESVELQKTRYTECLKVSFTGEMGPKRFEGFSYFAPKIGEVYSLVDMGEVKIDYALINHKL